MNPEVLVELRRATAEVHRAVEELAMGRGLLTSHRGLLEHVVVLCAHHGAVFERTQPYARVRVRIAERLGELEHDLGVLADRSAAPQLRWGMPEFPSEAHAMGACYVVEGSRLGGAVIARELAARGMAVDGLRSLRSSPNVGQRWRVFLAELQAFSSAEVAHVVEGAVWTFDALRSGYEALGRGEVHKSAMGPDSGSP